MNPGNKKDQKDPTKNDIEFILKLFNSNKLIDAKKEIDKQTIKYPNSSILFNILGAVLAGQKQFDKAVENYKKAIKINPNYAQAYNNLGIVLHKLNKINETSTV
jgi:Tfp pilus assembly protein PilF